jgi:alanine racemase
MLYQTCDHAITRAVQEEAGLILFTVQTPVLFWDIRRDGWMDMVRPGIMIYGHYPDVETPRSIPLLPGMSLTSRISFIKKYRPVMK